MVGDDRSTSPRWWPYNQRITVVLLTVVTVLGVFYWLRGIFVPLLVAFLIAYTTNPIVERLQKLRLPRWGAVSLLFLVLFATMVVAALVVIPQLNGLVASVRGEPFTDLDDNKEWSEGEEYTDRNENGVYDPGYQQLATQWARENASLFATSILELTGRDPEQIEDIPKALVGAAGESAGTIAAIAGDVASFVASRVTGFLTGFVNLMTLFFLIPVYTFFFLLELPKIWESIKRHLPGKYRLRLLRVGEEIHRAIALFLRGRIWIAVIKGFLTFIGLALLGVKFSFLIGMGAGILSILPFIGPVLGIVTSALVLYFDRYEVMPLVWLFGIFVVVEMIEGYVLYPLLLGKDLDLHPLTLIVSLFVGASVLGLPGLLLGVPAVCALKILAREFVLPPIREMAAEEPSDA